MNKINLGLACVLSIIMNSGLIAENMVKVTNCSDWFRLKAKFTSHGAAGSGGTYHFNNHVLEPGRCMSSGWDSNKSAGALYWQFMDDNNQPIFTNGKGGSVLDDGEWWLHDSSAIGKDTHRACIYDTGPTWNCHGCNNIMCKEDTI